MCNVAENGDRRRWKKVNLVISVDPQLEGHSSGKLVSFAPLRNAVGVDLTLDVDVLVGGDVEELDGNQRLRVVDLQRRGRSLNSAQRRCFHS